MIVIFNKNTVAHEHALAIEIKTSGKTRRLDAINPRCCMI